MLFSCPISLRLQAISYFRQCINLSAIDKLAFIGTCDETNNLSSHILSRDDFSRSLRGTLETERN